MAATLAERIREAEAAYHNLMTGVMARVVVDQNGSRVEFAAADRAKLYQYIADLKSQVPGGSALDSFPGPAQFFF